ncbi:MAG: arsenate reductase [Ideonella sp.]|nr:arsenate reductase [Ideonella sp.]MCC7457214.1 hypothetical protein [Nitrospira sp.]
MITVYGLAGCDTVRRARAWLDAAGRTHTLHDFKHAGVPASRLDAWLDSAGWQALLNRRGSTWRRLDAAAQTRVTEAASARALMLAQPSVIKRPVVEWGDGRITVGFDPVQWGGSAR